MTTIKELEQLIKQSRIISNLLEEIVDNSEIKVGDYVVLQKSYDNWNEEMNVLEGKIVKVTNIYNYTKVHTKCIDFEERLSNGGYCWSNYNRHYRKASNIEIIKYFRTKGINYLIEE